MPWFKLCLRRLPYTATVIFTALIQLDPGLSSTLHLIPPSTRFLPYGTHRISPMSKLSQYSLIHSTRQLTFYSSSPRVQTISILSDPLYSPTHFLFQLSTCPNYLDTLWSTLLANSLSVPAHLWLHSEFYPFVLLLRSCQTSQTFYLKKLIFLLSPSSWWCCRESSRLWCSRLLYRILALVTFIHLSCNRSLGCAAVGRESKCSLSPSNGHKKQGFGKLHCAS